MWGFQPFTNLMVNGISHREQTEASVRSGVETASGSSEEATTSNNEVNPERKAGKLRQRKPTSG